MHDGGSRRGQHGAQHRGDRRRAGGGVRRHRGQEEDAAASVTLVTDEACEPYEKPPLSKAVLLGKAKPEDAPIAGPGGLAKHGVTVKLNTRCTAIDRAARQVVTTGGAAALRRAGDRHRLADARTAAAAAGHAARALPAHRGACPRASRPALAACKHLVVIGAGLIGLEVAASAAELGIEVTVIEFAPRIMARACDEETGAVDPGRASAPRRRIRAVATGDAGDAAARRHRSRWRPATAKCTSPTSWWSAPASSPTWRWPPPLASTSQDGIVVDAQCRTSDPDDLRRRRRARAFPGRRARCGWRTGGTPRTTARSPAATPPARSDSYNAVPSFWTEQYDLYIQGVGWPDPAAQKVRRPLPDKSTLLLEVRDGVDPLRARHQRAARPRRGAPADRAQDSGRSRGARRSGAAVQRDAEGEDLVRRRDARQESPSRRFSR